MGQKDYKQLSIEEFSKAAEVYETDRAGVYKMCKKDYPDVLAELEKEPFEELLDCGCGTAPKNTAAFSELLPVCTSTALRIRLLFTPSAPMR